KKWRGVLDSHCGFALVMENDGSSVLDTYAKPFAMPVPLMEYRADGELPTVLPGAVEAFCYPERMVKLADTSRLGAWFRSKSGFRPSLADKVEKYFSPGQRKEIHSLVSLPFGTSNNESEEYQDEPFGVINIHSNRKDILKGEG